MAQSSWAVYGYSGSQISAFYGIRNFTNVLSKSHHGPCPESEKFSHHFYAVALLDECKYSIPIYTYVISRYYIDVYSAQFLMTQHSRKPMVLRQSDSYKSADEMHSVKLRSDNKSTVLSFALTVPNKHTNYAVKQ